MHQLEITPEVQVAEVATAYPTTLRMFEALGIDYCCGGKRPLREAAETAQVPVATVVAVLQQTIAQSQASMGEEDWAQRPLDELIAHIVATHHAYLGRELPRLAEILALVRRVHGAAHGDVLEPLARAYAALKSELEAHLQKEEEVVFPAILRVTRGEVDPAALQGITELTDEHEAAGEVLAEMHRITDDFAVPGDVCTTYAGLYRGLQELEQDIHQHIHLENNILFPRLLRLASQ